jgi:hypothetical protein
LCYSADPVQLVLSQTTTTALTNALKDRKESVLQLKHGLTVDVFLGYSSNCDQAGVEVRYQSLEIFRELQVPFGLSIIVTYGSRNAARFAPTSLK